MVGAHALRTATRRRVGALAVALVVVLALDGVYLAGARLHGPAPTPVTSAGPSYSSAPPATGAPVTVAPPGDLSGGLLVPEDMGGYYRVDPTTAEVDLHGSPCLAALDGPGAPVAHASTYLAVANYGDVPALLEQVDAYRTAAAAAAAWAADAGDLARCTSLHTTLAGGGVLIAELHQVPLVSLNLQATGRSAVVWEGGFELGGLDQTIDIAAVDGHDEVLVMIELDRNPPVAGSSIYDNFASAVVTAYGKLS
jgi:hypothetical protein